MRIKRNRAKSTLIPGGLIVMMVSRVVTRGAMVGRGGRPTMFDEQLLDCVAKDIHRLAGERGRVSQVRMHLNT